MTTFQINIFGVLLAVITSTCGVSENRFAEDNDIRMIRPPMSKLNKEECEELRQKALEHACINNEEYHYLAEERLVPFCFENEFVNILKCKN